MHARPVAAAIMLALVAGCAETAGDTSGIRIVRRTPDEFCRGTARNIAADRYEMKRKGVPLAKAIEANGAVEVIDTVTRAVYAQDVASAAQAQDAGTAACLAYFRGRR